MSFCEAEKERTSLEEKVYIWIFNPEVEKEIRGSRFVRLLPKLKPDRPTTKSLVI
jgi:hypothetical protein